MNLFIQKTIASVLGSGYIRPFSASWGSFVSGVILYFFWPGLNMSTKLIVVLITFLVGCFISDQIEKKEKLHDPYFVVIDEMVGMMITTITLNQNVWHWLLAFILFRFFDIIKFWPASIFDKRRGGFSIMFDDVIMALYAMISLLLLLMAYS